MTNGADVMKTFRLSFSDNSIASFDQFNPVPDVLYLSLFPYSSTTRVVYVASIDAKDS